jgi:hypothetical protein
MAGTIDVIAGLRAVVRVCWLEGAELRPPA